MRSAEDENGTKRIALVTDHHDSPLGAFLKGNLEEVLAGKVAVRCCFFDRLQAEEVLDDDLVLVMAGSRALAVKPHVPEARRILVVKRTIHSADAYRILAIPPGTPVLVVNTGSEVTLEMEILLQQLELDHVQVVPFEAGKDYPEIRIAITPGEPQMVPGHVPTIIDVGNRCVDVSTFIEIITRLRIVDREIDQRLLRYSEGLVTLDTGVNRQHRELFLKAMELDAVLNLSQEGILLLNKEGMVVLHNRSLAQMLEVGDDLTGRPASALPAEIREILARPQGREWIVEYRGRSLVVHREEIVHFGEPAGSCFNFQEVTYIRQLEQNLSRRLQERGLTARYRFEDIRAQSPRMLQCLDLARRVAGSEFTVLITGESGTGKELLAQSIHAASSRGKQPFVAVNCAAMPESLLESELFGYEGGAFTGALKDGKAGLFEQAHNGTVFLDEIGDMPLSLQAKLLRFLQERQVMRVGSRKVISVNIRVIAATNRDLREKIRAGEFREDLYFRLNVLPLMVPALRQRPEDILSLFQHFLREHCRREVPVAPEAQDVLLRYRWPGNIRELGNVASYVSFMADERVNLENLPHTLLSDRESFEREASALETRSSLERAEAVMQVLEDFEARDQGAGRKSVEEALGNRGVRMTEGEVRGIMSLLNTLELVHSGVGRRGSELTPRGKLFLNWLKNR
jgi:sigma-54 dependent transcriptional regulator, acetoin dehydrogenase operon transcriptional activator AcoR